MSIGKRLEIFAVEKFKSPTNLAKALGYESIRNIQPYLNDKSKPGSEILTRLAELECDINWLLTGKVLEVESLHRENQKLKEQIEQIRKLVELT